MPLVKVEIYKGKSEEYRRALLDGIHSALVEAIKIPDDDRTQRLYELEPSCFEKSGNKSDKVTLVEITLFKGRSMEAKKNLYRAIVRNLAKAPGISDRDIVITLNELPLESWSFEGGLPASESGVRFKIDV